MAKVQEVDVITGKTIKRDMTDEELALQAEAKAEIVAKEAEQAARAEEKAALLVRLGITADEAALLLG